MRTSRAAADLHYEDALRGALSDLRAERFSVIRFRVKMRDRFLQPREDFVNRFDIRLGLETVHSVSEANVDAAVPKPADFDVDFAVINLLKLWGQLWRHVGDFLASS